MTPTFERPRSEIQALTDWVAIVEAIEPIIVRDSTDVQLFISLREPLPEPYDFTQDVFNKVFLYLKNCEYKGIWRIKSCESNRKEIICENFDKNDGTRIRWELELEEVVTPSIPEPSSSSADSAMEIRYVSNKHAIIVKACEVNHEEVATARLTPPLLIECRATILSISCIDLVDQSFRCDFQCAFMLRNLGKMFKSDIDERYNALRHQRDVFDVEKAIKEFAEYYEFKKAVGFRHCREEESTQQWGNVTTGDSDSSGNYRYHFVYHFRRNGVFNARFNLRCYPVDEQQLTIAVILNMDQYSAKLVENFRSRSKFLHNNFHLGDIFEVIYDQVVRLSMSHTDPDLSSTRSSYSVVEYSVVLRREYVYFIFNFVIPILLITALSLTSFDAHTLEERLQIISSLWLTIVTYKLMLVDILPPISYFTLLNYYVILSFFFIALVAFVNIYPEEDETLERLGLIGLFLLVHAIAFLLLHVYIFNERRIADAKMRKYANQVRELVEKLSTQKLTFHVAANVAVGVVKFMGKAVRQNHAASALPAPPPQPETNEAASRAGARWKSSLTALAADRLTSTPSASASAPADTVLPTVPKRGRPRASVTPTVATIIDSVPTIAKRGRPRSSVSKESALEEEVPVRRVEAVSDLPKPTKTSKKRALTDFSQTRVLRRRQLEYTTM